MDDPSAVEIVDDYSVCGYRWHMLDMLFYIITDRILSLDLDLVRANLLNQAVYLSAHRANVNTNLPR